MLSNLKYPIIISKDDSGYNMILDGHHRLQKSIIKKEKYIKAKILDLEQNSSRYKELFGRKG